MMPLANERLTFAPDKSRIVRRIAIAGSVGLMAPFIDSTLALKVSILVFIGLSISAQLIALSRRVSVTDAHIVVARFGRSQIFNRARTTTEFMSVFGGLRRSVTVMTLRSDGRRLSVPLVGFNPDTVANVVHLLT